jgi:hypothetical protein
MEAVKNAIRLELVEWNEGVGILTAGCADYDEYKSLPAAVRYEGQVYGKAGWNSDTNAVYYRTDVKIAKAA